jgi:hypothetical protein
MLPVLVAILPSLNTQLDYMLYEGDWKMIEPYMKTPGKSIN